MRIEIKIGKECDLCGLCVEYCPAYVFKIEGNRLIVNPENCIYCRGCEVVCPRRAITIEPELSSVKAEVHSNKLITSRN